MAAGRRPVHDQAVRPRRAPAARARCARPGEATAPRGRRLMESPELRRLIVRHRHVAPMLSVLLAGTDARVTITELDGEVILDRRAGAAAGGAPVERHPIVIEGATVGWVEGPRPAGAIAAVLSLRRRPRDGQARARARGARSLSRAQPDLRPGRPDRRAPRDRRGRPGGRRRGRAACRPAAPGSSSLRGRRRGSDAAARSGSRLAARVRHPRATAPRSSTTSPPIPGRPRRSVPARRSWPRRCASAASGSA